jgi:site-specific recombinase XerD
MNELIPKFESFLLDNRGMAKLTVYQYTRCVMRLDRWLEEQEHSIETATHDMVLEFVGKFLHAEGCRRRSRNQYIYAFKRFFPWAWEQLGRNPEKSPAAKLEPMKLGKMLPRSMALKHADAVLSQQDLDTFVGIRDTAILMLLIGCGLRVSELCGLNEGHLIFTPDPEGGVDFLDLRVLGKGRIERLASAPKDACAAVRAYLGHPDLKEIDRELENGDKVLFVSVRSCWQAHEYVGEKRRMNRHSVRRMLVAYGKRAKVPVDELHPHALRHLYACHMLEKGVDLFQIQELLGHRALSSTQVYLQIATARRRQVVQTKTPLADIATPFGKLVKRVGSNPKR